METMKNPKFAQIAILLAMATTMAGCGGSGDCPAAPLPGITVSGGATAKSAITTVDLAATDSESTVNLQVDGATKSVVLPPLLNAVTTTTPLWVLPESTKFLNGFTRTGAALTRAPGDLIINGQLMTQVTMDPDGRLTKPLALPPGRYTFTLEGPWNLKSTTETLTTEVLTVTFDVTNNGIGFPTSIAGNFPGNGGIIDNTYSVTVQVGPSFADTTMRLDVLKSTGNLAQTLNFVGSSGTFKDIASAGQAAQIPSNGVTEIILTQGSNN